MNLIQFPFIPVISYTNEECNNEVYEHRNGNLGTSLLQHLQNGCLKLLEWQITLTHSTIVYIYIYISTEDG